MARSYYSVMLYHPADEVWAVIRPFDHYAWAGVESETIIEHGKAGDQVGAVRRVSYGGRIIRQVSAGPLRHRALLYLRVLRRAAFSGAGLCRDDTR